MKELAKTYPKRFPRKTKKKYIKAWGRNVYRGILKGHYILANINNPQWRNALCSSLPNQIFNPDDYSQIPKGLMNRYANKPVNEKYYDTIKIENIPTYKTEKNSED